MSDRRKKGNGITRGDMISTFDKIAGEYKGKKGLIDRVCKELDITFAGYQYLMEKHKLEVVKKIQTKNKA